MKKILSLLLISSFLFSNNLAFAAIKGHIEETDVNNKPDNKELFTGEVEVLKENKSITMTVSQVLSSGYTQVGDEFFAEVSSDVITDKGVIIPVGSVAHGKVNTIASPKNMGRDGYIVMDFDYIITPDGSQIPIQGGISTRDNLVKGTTKAVAEHVGYTVAGGFFGGLLALNLFGLEAAILSNGYTLAGGAAIGGVVGLVNAVKRKGEGFIIKPGDDIKIKVLTDVELPVYAEGAFRQDEVLYEGLDVKINKITFEKDPFGVDNTITLNLCINNKSKTPFSTFDIALLSDTYNKFYPSPFNKDDSLWFKTVEPGDVVVGNLSFSVHDKKRKHWLVFYDRSTKKPLAKISVDNAKDDLKKAKKRKRLFGND